MIAVIIDPLVCKSAYWWMFPECWGVIPMVGAGLLAIGAAMMRRRVRVN